MGGGTGSAVSGSGTTSGKQDNFVIHTGLGEVTKFVFMIHTPHATYPTDGVAACDLDLDASHQMNYAHYSTHYYNWCAYPFTAAATNLMYPVIRSLEYNGVAGDVCVFTGGGNTESDYFWFAE